MRNNANPHGPTGAEAAFIVGVARETIHRWVAQGRLSRRSGGAVTQEARAAAEPDEPALSRGAACVEGEEGLLTPPRPLCYPRCAACSEYIRPRKLTADKDTSAVPIKAIPTRPGQRANVSPLRDNQTAIVPWRIEGRSVTGSAFVLRGHQRRNEVYQNERRPRGNSHITTAQSPAPRRARSAP